MTRPIKFRAWDIEDKEMVRDISLEGLFAHYENGNIELMQFTGLTDKNGKEIYEGDIAYHQRWNGDEKRKAIIKFGIYEVSDMNDCGTQEVYGWYLEEVTDPDCRYSLTTDKASHLEVIGNIYENQELLEK